MSPARVAVVRCDTYDPAAIDAAVARGLELVGGAARFARAGERVVLKPNLLVPSAPEKAVTTHPTVFSAVARALLAEGASVTWGDSPGFGGGEAAGRKAGLADAASALGIAFGDFTHGREVSFPEGALIKRFTLVEEVASADGVVSLAKLKTHALTRMTGAIKNQFGCVPGMLKGEFHAKMPDVEHFATMLVDLNRLIRPRLFVIDAVVGMHGNGPRNGDPLEIGCLLFSADPVAADTIGCRIFGLDPSLVETLTIGERLGLGTMTAIELVGDELPERHDAVVNRAHASTTGGRLGSARMRNLLAPRPFIVHERCTKCGTCVAVCPVTPKAVDWSDGDTGRPPEHHYERCIRCYCCQEMCPERAIEVKTPPLGWLIRR